MQGGGTQQQTWSRVEHLLGDFATAFVRRNMIDRRDGPGAGSRLSLSGK